MRAHLAIKLLDALERHTPDPVIRLQMQILLDTTARGFGVKGRQVTHLPAEEALAAYAAFTTDCIAAMCARGQDNPGGGRGRREWDANNVQLQEQADREKRRAGMKQLYREAYRTGSRIRRITGLTESRDIERLVFWLYRNLRITMRGHIPGEITVTDCYFSRIYTPGQCAVMSMVDSGIIAGLCEGGKLRFTGRITEGCGKCTACFTMLNLERTKR